VIYNSTKVIVLGSTAFRQPKAKSHCRYIHGYNLYAKFYFESDELDENNWVVDFGSLKRLKNALRDDFDHKLVLSKSDPFLEDFKELHKKGVVDLRILDEISIEMFAEYCCNMANKMLGKSKAKCVMVEVFEHEKNSGIYKVKN
tara:strand:- start:15275 stop:15706 length:432 start_codon:yes stop_codon:yes gene_type:complete